MHTARCTVKLHPYLGHNPLTKNCMKPRKKIKFFSSSCLRVLWCPLTLSLVDAHPDPWDCAGRAIGRHWLPEAPIWAQAPGAHSSLHIAALLDTAQSGKRVKEDIAFSIPKVMENVPLATMGWWDLKSSRNEHISWRCRRQELHGIVSYTQMLKFKANISSESKWLKFCSCIKVKWFDSHFTFDSWVLPLYLVGLECAQLSLFCGHTATDLHADPGHLGLRTLSFI